MERQSQLTSGTQSYNPDIHEGFLLKGEPGQQTRVNEYHASKLVAEKLRAQISYDPRSKCWAEWVGTHWQLNPDPSDVIHKIAKTVATGCEPVGYPQRFRNAITQQIEELRHLPMPTLATGVVPFENGLLDIGINQLRPATPEDATDYVLPYKHDKAADCPTIKKWLHDATGGDEGTVELLRAFMAALVLGLQPQKFLLLIGPAGTGKGTFQRLMVELAGRKNTESSTLQNIEGNRFELARHLGKRLCLINEVGGHSGQLNMLKAMTGGDYLPLERKHQQQTGSFIYSGLVIMTSNEEIPTSDSGLVRRRLTVRFENKPTQDQQKNWQTQGGESAVLQSEIPGLVQWLLKLNKRDVFETLNNPPKRVNADNILGMRAGSSVTDWLLEECEFDPSAKTEMGKYKPNCPSATSSTLYPAYRLWCEDTGRSALAQNKFKSCLFDTAAALNHALTERKDPITRRVAVIGIKILGVVSRETPSMPSNDFDFRRHFVQIRRYRRNRRHY